MSLWPYLGMTLIMKPKVARDNEFSSAPMIGKVNGLSWSSLDVGNRDEEGLWQACCQDVVPCASTEPGMALRSRGLAGAHERIGRANAETRR